MHKFIGPLHLDVVEPNADSAGTQAGSQFIIDNRYFYSDLDDLLVNHVKAMSRKVDDLMASEKYKGGSDQDLRADGYLFVFVYFAHSSRNRQLAH